MMWIDLSAVLAEAHRPVRVAAVVRQFVVDTPDPETAGGVPSDE
jgi:hypothetical protein